MFGWYSIVRVLCVLCSGGFSDRSPMREGNSSEDAERKGSWRVEVITMNEKRAYWQGEKKVRAWTSTIKKFHAHP